jgi:hypothetical protein
MPHDEASRTLQKHGAAGDRVGFVQHDAIRALAPEMDRIRRTEGHRLRGTEARRAGTPTPSTRSATVGTLVGRDHAHVPVHRSAGAQVTDYGFHATAHWRIELRRVHHPQARHAILLETWATPARSR